MPELAEVEVARRHIERWWRGQKATTVKLAAPKCLRAGTPEALEALMTQHALDHVERRGKQLIACFEGTDTRLLIHFKLTGKITRDEQEAGAPDLRMAWHLPQTGWLRMQDKRALGELHLLTAEEFAAFRPINEMGPEPHDLQNGAELRRRIGKGKGKLKAKLLDQTVLAGVGNIAISELFWQLKLWPELRVDQLDEATADALVAAMPPYFDDLIASSEHIENFIYLSEGLEENPFSAYGRMGEPCKRCETKIEMLTFGGRSTYYCPTCQTKPNDAADDKRDESA
jgi:formamidopyrimidine-DNA glycosylase